MPDPRESLTEEMPESPRDYKARRLVEIDGVIQLDKQALTEDLPQEEESSGPQTLLG